MEPVRRAEREPEKTLARRGLLGYLASAAAALGLGSATSAAGQQTSPNQTSHGFPARLGDLPRLRTYKARRSSSADRSGGNADYVSIEPGATATILETPGPGTVTHIWFTIASDEAFHLKKLVLRAFWDGEKEPSVEVPVGDFFGLTLGDYFSYQSALTSVASIKALNAYFPMPFAKSARITITNEGKVRTDSFYYNVDYIALPELPAGLGYFHAQYRQAAPCKGWTNDWKENSDALVDNKKNLTGEGNYVFLEAQGTGSFIGVTHGIIQNQDGWFGEGDEMIYVDNDPQLSILGTGTEDYYNGAWNFGGEPFAYLHNGAPYIVNFERVGGRYCLYRWHTESPIAFQSSIKVTIEHGHANHRSDSFYSTAFWYQTEPHLKFPALPAVEMRIPRTFQVGGPGPAPLPAKD
jgi:Protein of unknown function (DUF2961)